MTRPGPKAVTKSGYPIVYSGRLEEARRGGFLRLGALRRNTKDLIRPDAGHHVLVFRVNGRYVLGNGTMSPRDEVVVRADQVTVVDMRKKMPVTVDFEVASKDRDIFTVVAYFQCSVTDPITVVRDGLVDPRNLLLHYVISHHNTSQMGLDFTLSEINDMRRYVNAQLTAYSTVTPPSINGLEVRMTSVDVRTPAEEAELSRTQRDLRNTHVINVQQLDQDIDITGKRAFGEHKLTAQQLDYEGSEARRRHSNDAVLQAERARAEADLAGFWLRTEQERDHDRRSYEQLAGTRQQEYDDRIRLAALRADLERQGELHSFQMNALRQASELIGNDPDRAIHLAYIAGNLDANELTDRLRDDRSLARRLDRQTADFDREYERETRHEDRRRQELADKYAHEQEIHRLELDRANARWEREETTREAARHRDLEERRAVWEREDEVNRRQMEFEARRHRGQAQLEVLRDLIGRGLLDASSIDFEKLAVKLAGPGMEQVLPDAETLALDSDGSEGDQQRKRDSRDQQ